MLNQEDLRQIKAKGIEPSTLEEQIRIFRQGIPYVTLDRPATGGDGIMALESKQAQDLARIFDESRTRYDIRKFVPASGAASRMFKDLHEYMEALGDQTGMDTNTLEKEYPAVHQFFRFFSSFAFFEDLKDRLKADGKEIRQLLNKRDHATLLDYLLNKRGLTYASLPKGMLKFHNYENSSRTAMEEHLVEAAFYTRRDDGLIRIHFTVSAEHEKGFRELADRLIPQYEQRYGVRYDITFSRQDESTDTIAVDLENEPFRDEDGRLLFRPGGHGALLKNLQDLDGDVVFIKNIDNVVPDRLKQETYLYKKVIGGLLLKTRRRISDMLMLLENGELSDSLFQEIYTFCTQELKISLPQDYLFLTDKERIDLAFAALNRPIRVCGMVRNEGEPGGGPFWVLQQDGKVNLQIVESSQVNRKDEAQNSILMQATHFNPVDLVCSLRDYKNEAFNLPDFVDPETGFIAEKSYQGRKLKALELPGLWNGAMARWITLFVEVPIITFNPVKTINDLLRKEHQ